MKTPPCDASGSLDAQLTQNSGECAITGDPRFSAQ